MYVNILTYVFLGESIDGFQSSNSEFSMMMGSNINNNGYIGAGIENDYMQQINYGSMDVPSQFSYISPVAYSSLMPTPIENLSLATPHLLDYRWNLPCDDSIKNDILLNQPYKPTIKDVRKSVTGAKLAQRNSVLGNKASLEASRANKKRKVIEQFVDTRKYKMQAPVKRSQKLSEKISALQELVSPYGKTDTASVLQEACIYIKIIHQEIRRLSISYFELRSALQAQFQGDAERQSDLQSKGLCLVPVSTMKSITRESWVVDHQTASRTFKRSTYEFN
ncbi:transcription factor bHLH111-like isoform X1 [Chenopodium quinoa]|uniref:transcription factor bHLH111-like isoform X1 n=1 Tax=Chenopodium quinoa TaxID=63459 RepID=UPI000B77FB8C|nr:transcription factor bHLH111-like isoform X1 [Chenopodium quinoa]